MDKFKDDIFIQTQKKTNQIMKGFNNKFGSLLGGLNLLEDQTDDMIKSQEDLYEDYSSEDESLFEDEGLFEDEDDDLFEDEDDDLFEDEDYSSKPYLGHEVIDGERVEYYMLEEGEYNEELNASLANFRKNRRLSVDTFLEDAIFDNFIDTLMEEKVLSKRSINKATGKLRKRPAKTIRMKDKVSKNGKKLKKTPPSEILGRLIERKSVKQIFKFNKKLRKKLMRELKRGEHSVSFKKYANEHYGLIPVNMKEVLESLSAKKNNFSTMSKMIKKEVELLADGQQTSSDYLTNIVLDNLDAKSLGMTKASLATAVKSVKTANGKFGALIDGMKAGAKDTKKAKAEALGQRNEASETRRFIARKAKAATDAGFETSPVKDLSELLTEGLTANSFDEVMDWYEHLVEAFEPLDAKGINKMRGVKGSKVPKGLAILMDALTPSFIGMLIQGAATGKYSIKFFSMVDTLLTEGKISQKVADEVASVQSVRSTAAKIAHDFKWIAMFNDLGLLGAKIGSKKGSKKAGMKADESYKIKGGKSVVKFIKEHKGKIEKLFKKGVPNAGWGGHRKGGKKNLSDSVKTKMKKESSKNVKKYLLEDAMALSPDDLALLIELL